MSTKAEFERAIRETSDPAEKILVFSALLGKDSGLGRKLIVAGGSAITLYTHGAYTSDDIDIVGDRRRIVPVLQKWGFESQEDSDHRVYWRRNDLGLLVDIVNCSPGAGHGRSGRPHTTVTKTGVFSASAVEDLIIRRLVRWSGEGASALMDQAVMLFQLNRGEIDTEYLETEVKYERVQKAYHELRRLSE